MIKVFIWGSCVSRDTLEFLPDWNLERYVARQSMLAAGVDATTVVGRPVFESPFQQRMSDWDLAGNALDVAAECSEADVFLLDLCDERHGVLEVEPGTLLTRSVERMTSGIDEAWRRQFRYIPFGTDEHYRIWLDSMLIARDRFVELGVLDRTVVVSLPWAAQTDAGEPTPSSFGLSAGEANVAFERYLRAMQLAGFRLVGVDIDPIGAGEHQWGSAPFHYSSATYEALAAELVAAR